MRKLFLFLLLGIAAIVYGQNPPDSAGYLFAESRAASAAGDFHLSATLLEQIIDGHYDLSDYRLALVYNSLGFAYSETGRLDEAYGQYRLAERFVTGTDQDFLSVRISIYINLAIYYKTLGDYSHSLDYNNEAYRMLSLIPEWDEVSYGKLSSLLLNRGITFYHLGRYQEALADLKECERIKKSHHHPYLGSAYFNLARVYHSLGDLNTSGEYYQLSIDQWVSEYDSTYYELANIYLNFGAFLSSRGLHEEGFAYLQKALENYQLNYGDWHPLTAACYESLARYELDRGNWELALDDLQLGLQSLTGSIAGPDHFSNPDISGSPHDLTLLKILSTKTLAMEFASEQMAAESRKSECLNSALSTHLLAIQVLDRIQNSFLTAESRIYLNSRQKDLFTTGIRLNLELHAITGIETYLEDAFLMAARGKSRELLFEMDEKEWLYLESLPDTMALKATELKQQNSYLSNLIQIENLARNPDSSLRIALQDQLFETRDSFYRQMELLRREFPGISQFESTRTDFSMKQIRRDLGRNETLVEYFMTGAVPAGREHLYAFVVTKKTCRYYQHPVDSAFHRQVQTITSMLHDFVPYDETRERFDSLKAALYSVYQQIFRPVEPFFHGRNLIIVPDEMLAYLPFDALITRLDPDTITNYAGTPYLVHDYNISYMYNSQLIEHHPSGIWSIPRITAWIPGYAASGGAGPGNLQGAEEEVRDILELTRGRSIQKSMDKQELVDLLQEPAILHLAMHSLAADNTGISPYFMLDSSNNPMLTNRMHDYEINALHLHTPMVVLSSCETAAGQLQQGEGIMSLSRSFLQAGASSVVHSLWPVEDVKSREIMVGFYRELKRGLSKSAALARVKKHYIAEQPPFYTHPYYWAAFQITGDISPLQSKRKIALIAGILIAVVFSFYGLKRRSFFRNA